LRAARAASAGNASAQRRTYAVAVVKPLADYSPYGCFASDWLVDEHMDWRIEAGSDEEAAASLLEHFLREGGLDPYEMIAAEAAKIGEKADVVEMAMWFVGASGMADLSTVCTLEKIHPLLLPSPLDPAKPADSTG